ncbi:MnuA family membrane nuclease [Mycoplasmopsis gallinarum]
MAKKTKKNKLAKNLSAILSSTIVVVGAAAGAFYAWKNKDKLTNKNPQKDSIINEIQPTRVLDITSNNFRIMNWNILNFGGNNVSTATSPKTKNIAKAIKYANASIIGLTEINFIDSPDDKRDDNTVVRSVRNLTKLIGENFNYEISKKAINPNFQNSRENYAFIYNQNEFSIENTYLFTQDNIYVRPPFGALFKHKATNYQFWYVIAHFDAPGVNEKNGEVATEYNDNGSQEILEATKVKEVIFDKLNELSPNVDIVFGGDTNLKVKANEIFENFKYNQIYSAYVDFANRLDDTWYNTSLSKTSNGVVKRKYANPYDKWLFKDELEKNIIIEANNPYKIDIVDLYNNNVWDKNTDLKEWAALNKTFKDNTNLTVAAATSDHAPIILNIKLPSGNNEIN